MFYELSMRRLSKSERSGRMQKTFDANPCCRDAGCSEKLVATYRSSAAALADERLLDGIRTLAYEHRFANMISERQLAALRRAHKVKLIHHTNPCLGGRQRTTVKNTGR